MKPHTLTTLEKNSIQISVPPSGATRDVDTPPVPFPLSVARRALWFAAALFWTAFAILEGINHGAAAIVMALLFMLAPDLTLLISARESGRLAKGRIAPRAVPYYNLAHRAVIPFSLAVLYSLTAPKEWAPLFAALCGWLAHISYDRAFGYGLRTKDGFQRG
ncbi:DUF4260 family protein [Streptomyces sp. NPDC004610]|uniref:DUF4260 family protein n=1 Tax=unclassified Streptomyces TaxID=2593676 RepID=UPI00339E023C